MSGLTNNPNEDAALLPGRCISYTSLFKWAFILQHLLALCTADTCLWPGLLTLSGNLICSRSLPVTMWPLYIPAHMKAETLWTEPQQLEQTRLTQHNTTDRALLQWELSTPWQNSSEARTLALFRGKAHWLAFRTHLEYSPLLTVGTLGMAPRCMGLCLSATPEPPIHGWPI